MAREFSSARTLRLVTQLASTTRAGLPITRTLSHLEENQHSRVLRRLWRAVGRDVAAGATFGDALARQSPELILTSLSGYGQTGPLSSRRLVWHRSREVKATPRPCCA